MKNPFKVAVIALMFGATTAALAQTPQQSFADRFAQLQALSSPSSPVFNPSTSFGTQADDPATPLTIAGMQALSSESPTWQLDHGKIDVNNGPTFAQTNPHGLPLDVYEAASSNSNEFKLAPGPDVPAYAAADSVNVATQTGGPSGVDHMASASARAN